MTGEQIKQQMQEKRKTKFENLAKNLGLSPDELRQVMPDPTKN